MSRASAWVAASQRPATIAIPVPSFAAARPAALTTRDAAGRDEARPASLSIVPGRERSVNPASYFFPSERFGVLAGRLVDVVHGPRSMTACGVAVVAGFFMFAALMTLSPLAVMAGGVVVRLRGHRVTGGRDRVGMSVPSF